MITLWYVVEQMHLTAAQLRAEAEWARGLIT
jgi:hypothetical protein